MNACAFSRSAWFSQLACHVRNWVKSELKQPKLIPLQPSVSVNMESSRIVLSRNAFENMTKRNINNTPNVKKQKWYWHLNKQQKPREMHTPAHNAFYWFFSPVFVRMQPLPLTTKESNKLSRESNRENKAKIPYRIITSSELTVSWSSDSCIYNKLRWISILTRQFSIKFYFHQ